MNIVLTIPVAYRNLSTIFIALLLMDLSLDLADRMKMDKAINAT